MPTSNLIVLIENTGVCNPLCNTNDTVRKVSRIDHPARETETAKGVAEVGRIRGEEETAYAELFGAALMDFVGGDVCEFVVSWFGVSGEHGFVFHGLTRDQLGDMNKYLR